MPLRHGSATLDVAAHGPGDLVEAAPQLLPLSAALTHCQQLQVLALQQGEKVRNPDNPLLPSRAAGPGYKPEQQMRTIDIKYILHR